MEEAPPAVASSALRHGLTEEQIQHAWRMAPDVGWDAGEGVTIVVGPGPSGELIEVGYVERHEAVWIIHAMPARAKFLR